MAIKSEVTQSDLLYFQLKDGRLARKSKEPREGFNKIETTLKDGTVSVGYFKFEGGLDGYLTGIDTHVTGNLAFYHIKLVDGDEAYQISIPCDHKAVTPLISRFKNCDLQKKIEIGAFRNRECKDIIFVKQDGIKIEPFYTKDDPKDLPSPDTTRMPSGQVKYNWDKVTAFFGVEVEKINKKLQEIASGTPPQTTNNPDDLPF